MKLIAPEMKAFSDRMRKASQSGDYATVNEERERNTNLRKTHGIKTWMNLMGLSQIPFLITWFLSLRYMAMNPDLFPQMASGWLF